VARKKGRKEGREGELGIKPILRNRRSAGTKAPSMHRRYRNGRECPRGFLKRRKEKRYRPSTPSSVAPRGFWREKGGTVPCGPMLGTEPHLRRGE